MMHSLHSQRVYNGTEDLLDFEEALGAEEDRRAGRRLPDNWDNQMGCFYREAARYAPQVERYLDTFGRTQVHVILFDEFHARTADVYRETCRFLEVDPELCIDFSTINGNKRTRSSRLRDFLRFASPGSRALIRAAVPSVTLRAEVKHRLKRLNTRYETRPPMDPRLRERLQNELRPDVEALGRLLGRDLMSWSAAPTRAVPNPRERSAVG